MEHILFNILSPFITFTYLDNWIYIFLTSEMLWASLPTRPQIPRFSLFPFICVCNWTILNYLEMILSPCQNWGEGTLKVPKSTPHGSQMSFLLTTNHQSHSLTHHKGTGKIWSAIDDVIFLFYRWGNESLRQSGHMVTRATESEFKLCGQFRLWTHFFSFNHYATQIPWESEEILGTALNMCTKCEVRVQVDLIQFSRTQESYY